MLCDWNNTAAPEKLTSLAGYDWEFGRQIDGKFVTPARMVG